MALRSTTWVGQRKLFLTTWKTFFCRVFLCLIYSFAVSSCAFQALNNSGFYVNLSFMPCLSSSWRIITSEFVLFPFRQSSGWMDIKVVLSKWYKQWRRPRQQSRPRWGRVCLQKALRGRWSCKSPTKEIVHGRNKSQSCLTQKPAWEKKFSRQKAFLITSTGESFSPSAGFTIFKHNQATKKGKTQLGRGWDNFFIPFPPSWTGWLGGCESLKNNLAEAAWLAPSRSGIYFTIEMAGEIFHQKALKLPLSLRPSDPVVGY